MNKKYDENKYRTFEKSVANSMNNEKVCQVIKR